jgi:hypothetical protein
MKSASMKLTWIFGLMLLLTAVASQSFANPRQTTNSYTIYLTAIASSLPETALQEIIVKLDVDQPGATLAAINQTYNTTTIGRYRSAAPFICWKPRPTPTWNNWRKQ